MTTSTSENDGQGGSSEISADLQGVAHLKHQEFDDQLDHHAIDESLATVAAKFEGTTLRGFVPLLVRRYVRDDLIRRLEHG